MKRASQKRWSTLGMALCMLASAGGGGAQTLWDDPAFALYRQAVEAFDRKEYDRASSLAREAIKHYPEHLLAHYLLGQAAMAQANWGEAVTAFRKIISIYPGSFAGHRELAIALTQLNKLDEAARAYQAALRLRADVQDVQARLAFLHLQAGKRDEAFLLLKGLADRGTKEPEAWYALGRLYYDRKDFAASEKAFSQAVALRDDGKAWFNLGVVRLRLEDQQGALKAFEQAARDPQLRDEANRQIRAITEHRRALEPSRRGVEPAPRR